MDKPIIGIIGRPNEIISGYTVISVHETLRNAIIRAGGIPMLILPTQDIDYDKQVPRDMVRITPIEKNDLIRQINMCDGIVMPGGFKWYEYDMLICNYVMDNDIPTIGLCMGMQLLAYVDNIKKSKEIITIKKNETKINHFQRKVNYVHDVNILDNTILKSILKQNTLRVNSCHNYHIDIVNEAKISAISEDNLIEGIEFPTKKFIIGIQWHPETIITEEPINQKIFDALIDASKKQKSLVD